MDRVIWVSEIESIDLNEDVDLCGLKNLKSKWQNRQTELMLYTAPDVVLTIVKV